MTDLLNICLIVYLVGFVSTIICEANLTFNKQYREFINAFPGPQKRRILRSLLYACIPLINLSSLFVLFFMVFNKAAMLEILAKRVQESEGNYDPFSEADYH
jgi:hypothetical protein